MTEKLPLAAVNALDRDAFVAAFGHIFERSPWVAERAWGERPFADVDALHAAMAGVVRRATPIEQFDLIRAHPDLAGKVAMVGAMSDESRAEQSSAGLDRCTPTEYALFQSLNARYKARFGFPFILAVRGYDRAAVLAVFQSRVDSDMETEFTEALDQIDRIARFRLDELIAD